LTHTQIDAIQTSQDKRSDSAKKEHSQQTNEICKRICLEYEVQNKGDLAKN
jgi:hypothetical protein